MATALQARVTAHEAVIDLQRRMTAIRFHGPGILTTQIRRLRLRPLSSTRSPL